MMKKTMKKPMKKADGGNVRYPMTPGGNIGIGSGGGSTSGPGSTGGSTGETRNPPALGIPTKKRMPEPNHYAMEHANERARFKRPDMDHDLKVSRPGFPSNPRIRSIGGWKDANPPIGLKKGGNMPMRKAKGGAASKGNWIQDAIKKPGALRSSLGAKKGQPIPAGKLKAATKSKNPTTAKRANLAMTLRGMKKK